MSLERFIAANKREPTEKDASINPEKIAELQQCLERDGFKENGSNYKLRGNCPFRPDSNSNGFLVWLAGDKIGWHDHVQDSKGKLSELATHYGIADFDYIPPAKSKAEYIYHDEAGQVIYKVIKTANKNFPQAHRCAGKWIWSMGGNNKCSCNKILRYPYHLQALAVSSPKTTVIICEGEKDVETAEKQGFIATCNSGGAGKWSNVPQSVYKHFDDKNVIVVADNDQPGIDHAADVAKALKDRAASLKVIKFDGKPGYDLTDWVNDGGSEWELLGWPEYTAESLRSEEMSKNSSSKPTHDELADRWIETAEKTAYGLGDWRRYDNGVWEILPELTVKQEIKKVTVNAKGEGIKPNSAIISSVSDLAKYDLATNDDLFDANIDYLVCTNGTLYIPTRTLGDHDPNLYATSGVGYAYDPEATATHWEVFLTSVFDEDVADFLQEFAGYCLTTDTSYEVAIWLHGFPGGGKSTFSLGITTMLGNRAGVLGLADIERSQFSLSNLPGKTLVVATEQPSIYFSATHILNAIVSGEAIQIDRKWKQPFNLIPRAKILWSMNGLPRINDPSNGLFRRVKVISMPPLPEDDKDPRFKREIEKEGAGILNWALDGLSRLKERDGFNIPSSIDNATENFKKNNDIPASFVADCCLVEDSYSIKSSHLYSAYRVWCLETSHKPQSSTSVAVEWKRLGFEQKRKNDGIYWAGVQLSAL